MIHFITGSDYVQGPWQHTDLMQHTGLEPINIT